MLATAAGVAINNAALFEDRRRGELERAGLQEIATALLTGTDTHQILEVVAERACEIVDADLATIALPDTRDLGVDDSSRRRLAGRCDPGRDRRFERHHHFARLSDRPARRGGRPVARQPGRTTTGSTRHDRSGGVRAVGCAGRRDRFSVGLPAGRRGPIHNAGRRGAAAVRDPSQRRHRARPNARGPLSAVPLGGSGAHRA